MNDDLDMMPKGAKPANLSEADKLLRIIQRLLWRANREYDELTDGGHGSFNDFPEAKEAIAALRKSRHDPR